MSDYGEKTRARIKDALETLVEEGAGRKPTVSEVLSRSGVARSTFYIYYENFQDLLEELATDYAAEVTQLIRDNRGRGTFPDSYREAYGIFIRFIVRLFFRIFVPILFRILVFVFGFFLVFVLIFGNHFFGFLHINGFIVLRVNRKGNRGYHQDHS